MKRLERNVLIILGIGAAFALAWGAVAVAGERADIQVEEKGKIQIVVVDEDGQRHEEVIEFDGDHPMPFLGVMLDGSRKGGARIEEVIEDTGADRAGLQAGDVIVSVDGQKIDASWDLTQAIMRSEPGDRVDVEVLRDGDRQSFSVELGERDHGFAFGFDTETFGEQMEKLHEHLEEMDLDFDFDFDSDDEHHGPHFFMGSRRAKLGVQLIEPTPELREHYGSSADEGILVSRVLPDTPAEEAGLRAGDLIVAIDGEPVEDTGDLRRGMRDKDGETIDIDVIRDGQRTTLSVTLREARDDETRGRGQRIEARPAMMPALRT